MSVSDAETTVAQLRQQVAQFVAERRWQGFHDAKNLAMSIAIEAAELMEHFQWVRSEELGALTRDPQQRARFTDELADVTCYVLAMANALDVDLAAAVDAKLIKNAEKYPAEQFQGVYYKPESRR